MTNAELATKLARAAVLLRDLGGEEEYDLADACEDAAQMIQTSPCREDPGITPYVPSLEAKVEQMIGDIAPDDDETPIGMVKDPLGTQDWPIADDPDEDAVPAEFRDLIGPKDDAEKQRRRRQMIAENVRLRMEAQERGRPLPDDAWASLAEAELSLYRVGDGLNGWTDVMENDGSETLNAIWNQAKMYVEIDPEEYAARLYAENLREIAERTAAALSIVAFGIGATDLSRLGEVAGH